jgi:triosephosphate isomerase
LATPKGGVAGLPALCFPISECLFEYLFNQMSERPSDFMKDPLMRPFVVAANWKMHKNPTETAAFFSEFLPKVTSKPAGREIVFFVPALDLMAAKEAIGSSGIKWGAQNCYFEMKGAFTGETSPQMLADIKATHCLVGHSERRTLFHETDEETGKKVKALQSVGVTPMLCVGETLPERESGKTNEVIVRQLKAGLALRDPAKPLTIAYEPVWAIGTGKVATSAQAGEAHAVLRRTLAEIGGAALADSTPILYGGSVKPDNAVEIAAQKEVDGFLVGGASLEVASFLSLCQVSK